MEREGGREQKNKRKKDTKWGVKIEEGSKKKDKCRCKECLSRHFFKPEAVGSTHKRSQPNIATTIPTLSDMKSSTRLGQPKTKYGNGEGEGHNQRLHYSPI